LFTCCFVFQRELLQTADCVMDFTESYLDTCSSVALAARAGNVEALERLIRQGKSLNQQDNRGWRPIHEAAFWGNSQCLRILLTQSNDNFSITAYMC
jgi:ankyrin repeat and SOCS box protein 3